MNENKAKLNIGPVRFSYLHVFEPRRSQDGETPKYSVTLLLPKDNTELVNKVKTAITEAYHAGTNGVFQGKAPAQGTWRVPLRDGDAERPEDPVYAGMYFINASAKTQPGIVKLNPTGNPRFVTITDQQELFSGCYGFADVTFFPFNNRGNKGVAAGLNNILKTKNGDFLGGRASADASFGEIPDDQLGLTDAAPNPDDIF